MRLSTAEWTPWTFYVPSEIAGDDLPTGDFVKDGHFLPIDPADPSKGGATLKCGSATYVCPKGPGFDMWGLHFKPGADEGKYPYGEQDDKYSYAHGAHDVAVTLFGKGTVPVKSAIARQFSIFNNYHSSWATPTSGGRRRMARCPPFRLSSRVTTRATERATRTTLVTTSPSVSGSSRTCTRACAPAPVGTRRSSS